MPELPGKLTDIIKDIKDMNDLQKKPEQAIAVRIKNEINRQLGDKETLAGLMETTFKGFNVNLVKRALLEGMLRGFTFQDFLERNVYAIPFRDGYSLVTSVDYARKVGMRSGVMGKSAPVYTMVPNPDNKAGAYIESCTVTVKRRVGQDIGEYTATVYFDEYTTGKNLWLSKPRTMIAKVAEMHALRMACPEELSQNYTEDELEKEKDIHTFDNEEVPEDAEIQSSGDDIEGSQEQPEEIIDPVCADCGKDMTTPEHSYSMEHFKKPLCRNCQKTHKSN